MPVKNLYHDRVARALIVEGWTITHDPLRIEFGERDMSVDLGAEHAPIGAEKSGRKIAVEIQSFLGNSQLRDFQQAVGQYQIYRTILAEIEPDRITYLAVPRRVLDSLLSEPFGRMISDRLKLRFLIYEEAETGALQWIESIITVV